MLFLGSTGSTFSASGSGYHCIIIMLLLLGTPTSVSTATTTMSRCFSITCCSVVDPALWICPAVVDPSFCLSCNQIVFWCFSVQGLCSVFLSSPWLDSLIWASSGRCWFVPSRVCPPMMVPAVLPHPGSVAWGIHLASADWQDIAVWHSDLLSIHLIPDLLRLKVIVAADPGGVDQGSAVLVGVPGRWPTADLTWVYCVRRRIQGHSGTGVSSVCVCVGMETNTWQLFVWLGHDEEKCWYSPTILSKSEKERWVFDVWIRECFHLMLVICLLRSISWQLNTNTCEHFEFHAKSLFLNWTAVSYNSSTIMNVDSAHIYRYKDKGMS